MNSANSQYVPLENEDILHEQLKISASACGYILHRQMQYYCVCNSERLTKCGHSYTIILSYQKIIPLMTLLGKNKRTIYL